MSNKGCYQCACYIFSALTIAGIIMFATSIGYTSVNYVSIVQNKFNKEIDDTKIYMEGRYMLGLAKRYY